MVEKTVAFKHSVGDGLHYITDNFRTFSDGSFQLGDTSEPCVLFALEVLLWRHNLPYLLQELWSEVYPNDFMALEDAAYILGPAVLFTESFDPHSPENIRDVLSDLAAIGCPELANRVKQLLEEKGVIL